MPSEFPRVTIRNPGSLPHGAECSVKVDGRPLTTVTAVSFAADVHGLVTVTITMYATVDVDTPAVVEYAEPAAGG